MCHLMVDDLVIVFTCVNPLFMANNADFWVATGVGMEEGRAWRVVIWKW